MSLPGITVPPGSPVFSNEGHAITLLPAFAVITRGTGHTRKRRVRSAPGRMVNVSVKLRADQMAAWDDWFENTLKAGSLPFAARVQNQGPGMLWWTAIWKEAYRADPLGNNWWRVDGTLVLSGVGSVDGPITDALSVRFGFDITGSAEFVQNSDLSVRFGIDVKSSSTLSVRFGVAIQALATTYRLREGGGYQLREGGGKRVREAVYG